VHRVQLEARSAQDVRGLGRRRYRDVAVDDARLVVERGSDPLRERERELRRPDAQTRLHRLERRAGELRVVAHLEELRRCEVVLHRVGRFGAGTRADDHAGHREATRASDRRVVELVDVARKIERHDTLTYGQRAERMHAQGAVGRGFTQRHDPRLSNRQLRRPALGVSEREAQLCKCVDRGWQRWRLAAHQREVHAHRHVPPQYFEGALRADGQRQRTFERALDLHLEQVGRALLQLHAREELGEEMKRQQLDQDVEPGVARDAEATGGRIQVRVGAELHRVRRQREVGVARQAGVVAGGQAQREPLDRREARGRREAVMESADGECEAARRGPACA
jgi:hypothetical protein